MCPELRNVRVGGQEALGVRVGAELAKGVLMEWKVYLQMLPAKDGSWGYPPRLSTLVQP